MKKFMTRLWKEQKAQDLVEYALLLMLMGLAIAATVRSTGSRIGSTYSNSASKVKATTTTTTGGNNGGDGGDGGGDGGGRDGGGRDGGGRDGGRG